MGDVFKYFKSFTTAWAMDSGRQWALTNIYNGWHINFGAQFQNKNCSLSDMAVTSFTSHQNKYQFELSMIRYRHWDLLQCLLLQRQSVAAASTVSNRWGSQLLHYRFHFMYIRNNSEQEALSKSHYCLAGRKESFLMRQNLRSAFIHLAIALNKWLKVCSAAYKKPISSAVWNTSR